MAAIEIRNISKRFKAILALDNISVDIEEGELFGFIGPDGAGKTALFKILVTLLLPDSGTARVFDYDVAKDYLALRKITGYMPGKFSLYLDLTVAENLDFFASVFGTTVKENYDLIKDIYVQLEPFKDRRAGKLSGGMKQKLALCCALIHKPRILVLDEPTTGVDAVSRREFWDMLKRLKQGGLTIIVSTPYMDEAEACDRIALMEDGKFLTLGTPAQITENFSKKLISVKTNAPFLVLESLRAWEKTWSCFAFGDAVHLALRQKKTPLKEVEAYMAEHKLPYEELHEIHAEIEDCFMDFILESRV